MQEDPILRISNKIKSIWANADAWPDYEEAMYQALPLFNLDKISSNNLSQWMLLPGLCCQAAGGQSHWADDIITAWFLFYVGAHIMDSVEDQDPPDNWWIDFGSGIAVNVASGFYFSASIALQDLHESSYTRHVANEVIQDFNRSLLAMCGGQHRDLSWSEPTLDQYWQTTGKKSGTFFSLACRSGARLGTDDSLKIESYSKFGYHLGVLVQIFDDLEDLEQQNLVDTTQTRLGLRKSLPFVYALEVVNPEDRQKLEKYLCSSLENHNSIDEVIRLLDESEAALYIQAEIERQRSSAMDALKAAEPESKAGDALLSNLQNFGKL